MVSADHPVALVCEVLGCSRSSYYYQGHLVAGAPLLAVLWALALRFIWRRRLFERAVNQEPSVAG